MKKNSKKGITVTSIVVYVILFFMFTTITTVLSSKINGNLFNDRGTSINITAINKLEYNLLDSADKSYSVKGTVNDNSTILTFSNNDEYVFDKEKHKIYKNGGELVDFLKDFDIRAIDDYLKINITLNKYTNEIEREIIVNVPVTNEYVLADRIIHYDGIDNVGSSEQDNKSMTWYDLSGNEKKATLTSNFAKNGKLDVWTGDGLLFSGDNGYDKYISVDYYNKAYEKFTFEFNVTPLVQPGTAGNSYIPIVTVNYGTEATLSLRFRNEVALMHNSGDETVFANLPILINKDNTYTFTFIQENLTTRSLYINGTFIARKAGLALEKFILSTMRVYNSPNGNFILHSIRVYDRALTKEEIVNNSQVDKLRFGM